jgi:hypothetical protein
MPLDKRTPGIRAHAELQIHVQHEFVCSSINCRRNKSDEELQIHPFCSFHERATFS